MKRHNALLAVAALTMTALLSGCTSKREPVTTPGTPPASASPAPVLPATPPTYTMPANLCTAVDAGAFADLAPAAPPKAAERGRAQTARHSSSTCMLTLGTGTQAILVSVGVDLWNNTFGAQGEYEGFHGVVFKDYPSARDITAVGTSAYVYTDPDLGPHLVTWFGNAHLSVSAVAIDKGKQLPADIDNRLIATAKATLTKLPTA